MKRIIVAAKALNSGGVEVSLVNFLNELVKNKDYEVTLLLCDNNGFYKRAINKSVHVREVPFKNAAYNIYKDYSGPMVFVANLYRFVFKVYRKLFGGEALNRLFVKKTREIGGRYDVAIDYHGYGYFMSMYLCNKVEAKRRVMFIHDEKLSWTENVSRVLPLFDYYYCVSDSCAKIMKNEFSSLRDKVVVFRNIINAWEIIEKSNDFVPEDFGEDKAKKIVTVGRLEWQKGYDLLLEAASLLLRRGADFRWYIIGTGHLRDMIEREIRHRGLSGRVVLLGFKSNPYPYIKSCDLYVQTSKHEGYGLAIAEARVLCRPILSTDIDCVREQITDGKNGFLVEMDGEKIGEKILEIVNDCRVLRRLSNELLAEREKGQDVSDMKVLNKMIEEIR